MSTSAYFALPEMRAKTDSLQSSASREALLEQTTAELDAADENESLPRWSDHRTTLSVAKWEPVDVPHFVPSWEGLRGIAVLLTLVTHVHTWSERTAIFTGPGGVMIFLVLSGFLITGLLVKQQEIWQEKKGLPKNSITYGHLKSFYMDRSARLHPALLSMVASTTALQYYIAGHLPTRTGFNIFITLFYLSDIDVPHSFFESIWGNTWTLAVEEQFYIFWSLTLPICLRFGRNRAAIAAFALGMPSFIYSILWQAGKAPSLGHEGFQRTIATHVWAMFFGAGARLAPMPRFVQTSAAAWLGLGGLTLLGISAEFPREPLFSSFPRLYVIWCLALLVLFTLLIVIGTVKDGNILLDCEPLRFVGRISYSLYLYQVPLLMIFGWPRGWGGCAWTSMAFLFAMSQTLYLEEPLRATYRRWRARKQA